MVIKPISPFNKVEDRRLHVSYNAIFKNIFRADFLKRYFLIYLRNKNISTGVDRITQKNFINNISSESEIIERKVKNKSYNFSKYRGVSINKGYNKYPRIISIPTVRDYLTLSIINDYLTSFYKRKLLHQELVQSKVSKITQNISKYSIFYKVDLQSFYDTIPHNTLIQKLQNDKIDSDILFLIERALKQSIVLDGQIIPNNSTGVFQGLPISNVLAEIFMIDIDKTISESLTNIMYFRYVDDILIMSNNNDQHQLESTIHNVINNTGLTINTVKTQFYAINDSFEYLGYQFIGSRVTVSKSTLARFENRLELLFKRFKSGSLPADAFILHLNLRITGFVQNNKKYGWLFFFSQINDLTMLSHLDAYIQKLLIRFGLKKYSKEVKKFLRAYNEIIYNLHNTTYIIDFNAIDDAGKKQILVKYFNYEMHKLNLSTEELDTLLNSNLAYLKNHFESDVQHIS